MSTATSRRIGVLVMAYGTPRSAEEIEPYYTDIRRGNPPTPEALADLVRRYDAIGGVSPLAHLTESQAAAIQSALDTAAPGRFRVAIGLKHAEPKIEQAARRLVTEGADAVVGVVLAPHFSAFSVGQYLGRAADALSESGTPFAGIESWATEPDLVDYLGATVTDRRNALRAAGHDRIRVLFTAHSLPERILQSGDPYPDELSSTAAAVAGRAGLADDDWEVAWQSAGRTPEPWLGPDILDAIDDLAGDVDAVLVCPCGFVADHLEVLYDLDIEAAARADDAGLGFARTDSLNADPAVMNALARQVLAATPTE